MEGNVVVYIHQSSSLPVSAVVGPLFHYRALRALTLVRYVRYACHADAWASMC